MRLLEDLRREHDLIERVLGSLRAFVTTRLAGGGDPAEGERYLSFFRHYAGSFHHDKEETVFFRALVEQAELPAQRGPIAAMTAEHRQLANLLEAMAPHLRSLELTAENGLTLQSQAVTYSRSLWRHIDAENSVVFPEGQERLRRAHVHSLPSRPMTPLEQTAHDGGLALLLSHPPEPDPEAIRGEGCVLCPSYGTSCDGLEREWWTELEWEETWERSDGD